MLTQTNAASRLLETEDSFEGGFLESAPVRIGAGALGRGLIEGDAGAVEAPGRSPGTVDLPAAERAIADFLRALGRDVREPHLAETPRRVAGAFREMLTPRETNWTTFPNDGGYRELVLVKNIPFHSLCEHHLLPFRGVAHIGYLPGDRLLGLSKLARGLELFARDLQVQERLTTQVADWLRETLNPRGAGVVLEAEHLCMSLRGVQSSGTVTRTSTFYGELGAAGPLRDQFPN
ncbi:GTP cyclohydrolase I [Paenarthrobacter sp. PH39-S1]|uniref:GTP cyclohydrolase I n=1 Tax=Paenarthrobacter sp. PH39-S1 TaxID=3046204 RepID=UPI0024B9046E|nr:GTP cyclohydrolase I [Paenarthrobacter sp. PH39-S1]MDJ0356471.1 GTP cyclohydrolase I [Paenarthrobacter sp. PH39-S1]